MAIYQEYINDIENELDEVWPGWRSRQPFNHLDVKEQARVKWLLKRHSLLSEDRDWPVKIVYDQKGKCYAHPVVPPWPDDVDFSLFEPPRCSSSNRKAIIKEKSDAHLALELGISIQRVREYRGSWDRSMDFSSYLVSQLRSKESRV